MTAAPAPVSKTSPSTARSKLSPATKRWLTSIANLSSRYPTIKVRIKLHRGARLRLHGPKRPESVTWPASANKMFTLLTEAGR